MLAVYRAPTGKNLVLPADFHAEFYLIHRVAGSDLLGKTQRQLERGRRAVKHFVYIFAKRWFLGILHNSI